MITKQQHIGNGEYIHQVVKSLFATAPASRLKQFVRTTPIPPNRGGWLQNDYPVILPKWF